MDERGSLLSSPENRLQESVKELEEGSKADFFGIWADKEQDVADYVWKMKQELEF